MHLIVASKNTLIFAKTQKGTFFRLFMELTVAVISLRHIGRLLREWLAPAASSRQFFSKVVETLCQWNRHQVSRSLIWWWWVFPMCQRLPLYSRRILVDRQHSAMRLHFRRCDGHIRVCESGLRHVQLQVHRQVICVNLTIGRPLKQPWFHTMFLIIKCLIHFIHKNRVDFCIRLQRMLSLGPLSIA